jgi:hypothetical protein
MQVDENNDLLAELERLDRWMEGKEEGDVPLDVLRARGLEIPEDDAELSDAALHAKLWEIIRAMADLGMVLESTNHLSDRELYRYLVGDCLREETLLCEEGGGLWQISPIGGFSEEDIEIYLRYYADDATRARWSTEDELVLPPKEKPPYDRDRFLPGGEREPAGPQ